MNCTAKSHKPAGEIKVRPLHTSVGHFLSGFAAWVDLILSCILKEVSYVWNSSKDVIDTLNASVVPDSACLVKLDVKDFF